MQGDEKPSDGNSFSPASLRWWWLMRRCVPAGHPRGGSDAAIPVAGGLSPHPKWCYTQTLVRCVPCRLRCFPHSAITCSRTLSPRRRAKGPRGKEPSRAIFHRLTKRMVTSSLNLTHMLLERTCVVPSCLFLTTVWRNPCVTCVIDDRFLQDN